MSHVAVHSDDLVDPTGLLSQSNWIGMCLRPSRARSLAACGSIPTGSYEIVPYAFPDPESRTFCILQGDWDLWSGSRVALLTPCYPTTNGDLATVPDFRQYTFCEWAIT